MAYRVAYGGGMIKAGLIFYLDAARPSSYPKAGTTWIDESPVLSSDFTRTPNNGSLQNGPVYNISDTHNFLFDGTNDHVTTSINYGENPVPRHTISVWFKTDLASGKKIIGFENTQSAQVATAYDRNIYMGTNSRIYYGVFSGSVKLTSSSIGLNDNIWHNAVGVANEQNQILLYIDGTLVNSNTGSATTYGTGQPSYIRIGSYLLNPSFWTSAVAGYFPGNIAQAAVYNRALSADEVLKNYNAMKSRFGK